LQSRKQVLKEKEGMDILRDDYATPLVTRSCNVIREGLIVMLF
jgi:hypothetical protein